MPAALQPTSGTERAVTTAEVAEALGVSVSTIKRWIDRGVLPAHRTAGGHRRLLAGEVVQAVHARALPQRDLALLGATQALAPEAAKLTRQLLTAMRRGSATEVSRVLETAHAGGLPAARLADRIVAPAMAALGHDWEAGRIDVYHEHRGTELCAGALYALRASLLRRPRRVKALAIGGGIEGDPYVLANLLAELVLIEAGWEVANFGPNTPLASFAKAVKQLKPKLLWLSVSHLPRPDALSESYGAIYQAARAGATAIAIGGQALTREVRARLTYTMFGDGLQQFADFAATLRSR